VIMQQRSAGFSLLSCLRVNVHTFERSERESVCVVHRGYVREDFRTDRRRRHPYYGTRSLAPQSSSLPLFAFCQETPKERKIKIQITRVRVATAKAVRRLGAVEGKNESTIYVALPRRLFHRG
jgi:hypothetical protein